MGPSEELKKIAAELRQKRRLDAFKPISRELRCPPDNFYLGLAVHKPVITWTKARQIAVKRSDIEDAAELEDRGEFHITVFSPRELRKVLEKHPDFLEQDGIKITTTGKNGVKYLGIGRAEKGENITYFIVVDWPAARKFRKKYLDEKEAAEQDFHITLGFKNKDVFGVSKGIDTILR